MKFNLKLFEGTDSIRFGMTREEIQSILKIKPILFKESEIDLYETEDYNSIYYVYYEITKDGKIVSAAFKFFKPSEVYLDNVQLIGEKREKIETLFKSKFEDCEIELYGFNSRKSEVFISLTMDLRIQTVYIARKGYGDQQRDFYEKALSSGNTN